MMTIRSFWALCVIGIAGGSACGASATDAERTGDSAADSSGSWRVIAAGGSHTCGLTKTDHVYCWGTGSRGELGNGTTDNHAAPVAVSGANQFKAVYSGEFVSCGITSEGESYCWGFAGSFADSVPTRVGGSNSYVSLAIDEAYICGLTAVGTVYCWPPFGDFRSSPTQVSSPVTFTSIVGGAVGPQICGLTAGGAAYCWGNWTLGSALTATAQPSSIPFVSIATGGNDIDRPPAHVCGLTADGTPYCWGSNAYGELGNGTTNPSDTPAAVRIGVKFSSLIAMDGATMGLTLDGHAYVWGAWLGTVSAFPVPLTTRIFSQLSIGFGNICGVTPRGAGYCWARGPIGDGVEPNPAVRRDYPTPIRVIDPP